jgi:hypothetical protein
MSATEQFRPAQSRRGIMARGAGKTNIKKVAG